MYVYMCAQLCYIDNFIDHLLYIYLIVKQIIKF